MSGEVTVNDLKDVAVEDLLGREPIQVNTNEILDYVQNQVVLITGGGGSMALSCAGRWLSTSPSSSSFSTSTRIMPTTSSRSCG